MEGAAANAAPRDEVHTVPGRPPVARPPQKRQPPFRRRIRRGATKFWRRARFFFVTILPALMALGLSVFVVIEAFFRDRIEIASFSAPAAMSDAGLSGDVIARMLRDEMSSFRARSDEITLASKSSLAGESADISIPGVGITLGGTVHFIRRMLEIPTRRISGDASVDPETKSAVIRVRISDGPPIVVSGVALTPSSVAVALMEVARRSWLVLSPHVVIYADYSADDMDSWLLLRQSLDVAKSGPVTSESLAMSLNLAGLIHHEKFSDFQKALLYFSQAIEKMPGCRFFTTIKRWRFDSSDAWKKPS